MIDSPSVYIIIVTYNGMKWLDKCLGSLIESTYSKNIIVIDNKSSDGTVDYIKKKFPEVTIIEGNENLGFGRANNIGFRYALKNNADYLFLINQDAWVESSTIARLINLHTKNPEYGITSPLHYNGKGDALDFKFAFLIRKYYSGLFLKDLILQSEEQLYPIEFINAAGWLISKECVEVNGGFNPVFPHYGEDNEYIYRAHFNKFKIGVASAVKIFHGREQSDRNLPLKKIAYMEMINFMKPLSDLRLDATSAFVQVFIKLIRENIYYFLMLKPGKVYALNAGFIRAVFKWPKIKRNRTIASQKGAFL